MYALDLKEDVLGCLHRQVCTADLRLGRQSLALDILRHHRHRIWCEQALPTRGTATHGARESGPREPDGWCPSGSNRAQPTPPWLPLTVRAYVGALREQRLCICAPPAQAVPNFALTQPPRLSHPRNRFQRLNDAIRRNDPNGWLLDNYAEALRAIKPKAFLMENVYDLAHQNQNRPVHNRLVAGVRAVGYALGRLRRVPHVRQWLRCVSVRADLLDVAQDTWRFD